MGKNKKQAAKVIPAAPTTEKETVVEPEVINNNKPIEVLEVSKLRNTILNTDPSTLDANHRVECLMGLDRHFMQPNAAEKLHISEETVKAINALTAQGWVAAMASEIMFGKSDFAEKLRPSMVPVLIEAGKDLGITFNQKLLAQPAKDVVEITSNDIKISKETEKVLKEEKEIADKPSIDPTQIENEDQLKESILKIMIERPTVYQKLSDSINFYRAYISVKASKSKNKEAELKKINSKTDVELLQEIRKILKECPFVLNGMGRTMERFTASSKSPIPAFCMFRNATKNRKTGVPALGDKTVADFVRVLVEWSADLRIAHYETELKKTKENIKVLSSDKKANAKGIEECEKSIEQIKKNIDHIKETIEAVSMPTGEIVDKLLENYKENDKSAQSIFSYIINTYYADVEIKSIEPKVLKHNVQQYAGIITNLFRDDTTPLMAYAEANILDIDAKSVEDATASQEEVKTEEPKKELRKVK